MIRESGTRKIGSALVSPPAANFARLLKYPIPTKHPSFSTNLTVMEHNTKNLRLKKSPSFQFICLLCVCMFPFIVLNEHFWCNPLSQKLALSCMNRVRGARYVCTACQIFLPFRFHSPIQWPACWGLLQPHDQAAIPKLPASLGFERAMFSAHLSYLVALTYSSYIVLYFLRER